MKKEALLDLTIKQLTESLSNSPECFELFEDPEFSSGSGLYTVIVWKFKVIVDGSHIPDPNNSPRTIMISYSYKARSLRCDIFLRDVDNPRTAIMSDAFIEIHYKVPFLNLSYIRFKKFRRMLINKIKQRENIDYIKKLNSIFPSILDDNLF